MLISSKISSARLNHLYLCLISLDIRNLVASIGFWLRLHTQCSYFIPPHCLRFELSHTLQRNSKLRKRMVSCYSSKTRPGQKHEPPKFIEAWVASSGITIAAKADTSERVERVQRLLYTWKDCFAAKIRDIKATDVIDTHFGPPLLAAKVAFRRHG